MHEKQLSGVQDKNVVTMGTISYWNKRAFAITTLYKTCGHENVSKVVVSVCML